MSRLQLGNGLHLDYVHDPATEWLTRITGCTGCTTPTPTIRVDRTYGHNLSGHVTSIEDAMMGNTQLFGLDHLYRLKTATASAAGSYGALAYSYDTLGNLTSKEGVVFSPDPTHPHQIVSTSNGSSFRYWPDGSLEWNHNAQGLGPTYEYDEASRLALVTDTLAGTSASYLYNAQGRRVRREESVEGSSTTTILTSNLYEEEGVHPPEIRPRIKR